MPFTFSHPAIILPLSKIHKSKLSLTGLIAGSLAPDFEYFILMKMQRTHGHEMSSFLWFNLPLCIILAFIYHQLLKIPLTNSLPHFLYSKLAHYRAFNWNNYFKKYWYVFVYSSAIGVFSHVFWDSFTHDNGLFGRSPNILMYITSISDLKVYEALQWLSTVIGGLYGLYFLHKLPTRNVNRQPLLKKMTFWMNTIFIMSFIFMANQPANISAFIATIIGSFLYGIIGSACYYLVYEKIYKKGNPQL